MGAGTNVEEGPSVLLVRSGKFNRGCEMTASLHARPGREFGVLAHDKLSRMLKEKVLPWGRSPNSSGRLQGSLGWEFGY